MTYPLPDPGFPGTRRSGGAASPGPKNSEPPAPQDGRSLRHARFLAATEAEGPGMRAALWLQGCGIHCPGCFNPHLWSRRGGTDTDTADAARSFVDQARSAGAQGLTLLGGEPFEQAAAAAVVAAEFQAAGLGVMTFTGYTYGDLQRWSAGRQDIAALLAATDLLADGPYLADRPERHRPWVGSTNQGLRALTPRYRNRIPGAEVPAPDRLEIRIAADGTVAVNGWAETSQLEHLLDGLSRPVPPRPASRAARSAAPEGAVLKEAP